MNKLELTFHELTERIKPILAGHEPAMQSAVLAELLSIFLAGNYIPDDPAGTRELREHLLTRHCLLVRDLVEINAQMLGIAQ